MTLQELKTQLLEGIAPSEFIILLCKDGDFIANQYVERMCQLRHVKENRISSVYDPLASALSLVVDSSDAVNVLRTDKFDERSDDYSQFANTVVICSELDKSIASAVKGFTVAVPALQDWQVKAYMKAVCKGIDQNVVDWLYAAAGGDIYRIVNELDKLALFEGQEREQVIESLMNDPKSGLYPHDDFVISNALETNKKEQLADVLLHINCIKYDPIAVANSLLKKLKNMALIKLNSGATASELGVSPQYYNYIKNRAVYPLDKLFDNVEFLSGLDLRLKSSELELTPSKLMDYIICKLMA